MIFVLIAQPFRAGSLDNFTEIIRPLTALLNKSRYLHPTLKGWARDR